jgi:alkanesulfonate monooxygenase SsuD/methylene tetrahydromethanopterin reductase-like flavin-dependent oxidoreductase (luciferase family)
MPSSIRSATSHRLKIGIFLPAFEYMMDGRTARWTDLLAFVRRAEDLGFDSARVPEHFLFHFDQPNTWTGHADGGAWECWSLLAALAATTTRIELGPLVSCTGFHNPARLAKMADTIDEIAGGRLILGLGAGWNSDEFRAFGFPFEHRVSRFEEAIKIIHTLLHEGAIDFQGTYYQARECELRPRGPRSAGPPILIGTKSPRMLHLTAQYADFWNFDLWGNHIPAEIEPLRASVDAACVQVGRDPVTLGRTLGLTINQLGRTDIPTHEAITGAPEELAGLLRGFEQEGISHIQVLLLPDSFASLEAFAPTLELLRREQSKARSVADEGGPG